MSDVRIRELERQFAASGERRDRDRLLRAGERAGRSMAWARGVMGGPAFDTFLTWSMPPPHHVHLVRATLPIRRPGKNSPLLCCLGTTAAFPVGVIGIKIYTLWPLHLVWRKQDQVTCKACIKAASVFGEANWFLPSTHPDRWSVSLARYQASFWGMWHPILWDAWMAGLGLP